ncbi:MAG: hypothetical protein COA77_07560 [Thaumarchaeota archaeon]|nr:MAG: hypothetical protein COA77_07560 [Nitrososphaerota archaeon]
MTDSKLAVIFDFDDTLVPDTTTQLLQKYGINTGDFWSKDVKSLIDSGYEPTLAYLNKFLENIGKDRPFGKLTNKDLRDFGKTLDGKFFSGPSNFR